MPACGSESVSALWASTPRSPSPSGRRFSHVKTFIEKEEPVLQQTKISLIDIIGTIYDLFWSQLVAIPTIWLCLCLWCFQKAISILDIFSLKRKKTVIVSGGSTVQGLQLARQLHRKGIRVIMVEVEGFFSLARFSSAVYRCYTLPKPNENILDYILTLSNIVKGEGATAYIPVSSTSEAIYDALAKPHLEMLQCSVLCPRSSDVRQLDDLLEVLERCRHSGLPTPLYYPVTSLDDVYRLYDSGLLRSARHFMTAVGSSGVRKYAKIPLPPFRQDFRPLGEVSLQKPWVIVQELQGEHLQACCTIRDGNIVGSVACRQTNGELQTVAKPEVLRWVQQAIRALRLKSVSSHLALDIVVTSSGAVVPLSVRVGVSPAYVCHFHSPPPLLGRTCKHICIEPSGTTVKQKDLLFTWWDPLPYCAFNHLLLPAQLLRIDWVLGVRSS